MSTETLTRPNFEISRDEQDDIFIDMTSQLGDVSAKYQGIIEDESGSPEEEYGASLSSLRSLGNLALAGGVEVDQVFESPIEARDDFVTALGENLATDPQYGEFLYFNPAKKFDIVDGQTVDGQGKPIIQTIKNGLDASSQAAETDPNMKIQAIRDFGDFLVGEEVDALVSGEMLSVVSFDPKKQLEQDKKYWEAKGYRKGMAVLQTYYKTKDNKLLAWAHAIKNSYTNVVAQAQNELGMDVDFETDPNLWIRQIFKKSVSYEEATMFAEDFLGRVARISGDKTERFSVTDFIEEQSDMVDEYFSTYMVPLAVATASKQNNVVLKTFAMSVLEEMGSKISGKARDMFSDITTSETLQEEQLRFLEDKLRYSLVEQLRLKIPDFIKARAGKRVDSLEKSEVLLENRSVRFIPLEQIDYHQLQMHNKAATAGIIRGSEAGRNYGGCSNTGGVDTKDDGRSINGLPQDVFGGAASQDSNVPSDKYGSLEFYCTEGHKNTRESGELIDTCQKTGCKGLVCAPKEDKKKLKPKTDEVRSFFNKLFRRQDK